MKNLIAATVANRYLPLFGHLMLALQRLGLSTWTKAAGIGSGPAVSEPLVGHLMTDSNCINQLKIDRYYQSGEHGCCVMLLT